MSTTATWPGVWAAWEALRDTVDAVRKRDEDAAQAYMREQAAKLAAGVSTAQRIYDVARVAAGVPNPLASGAVIVSGIVLARRKAAQREFSEETGEAATAGHTADASVAGLLVEIDGILSSDYRIGRDTPTTFDRLSDRWNTISQDTAALREEINTYGTSPSWQAAVSSASYAAAVEPQLRALEGLQGLAANNKTVTAGVATLQGAIYASAKATLMGSEQFIAIHGAISVAQSSSGQLYHGTLTARETLTTLKTWLDNGARQTWVWPSVFLSIDLAATVSDVSAAIGGQWPGIGDGGQQAEEQPVLTEVQERDFSLRTGVAMEAGDSVDLG
ncbi:hypothetical protein GCM10009785_24730 [Brooklawnia cerclae]|uniref:ESX-1 secretion-associated protein EspA/EspE-like domain-containing protein n=1 Tax=Brooklawnia cerclae TaxID=349934 RepID=A0ABX0SAZ5_9ACTN|nr:hypothetical protein [Brooklawnia cerclae]NIH55564.1 hypothetical protein [Brooklawnia cerclae]